MRFGEPGSRLCQYKRGELEATGDESNGDEFSPYAAFIDGKSIFCHSVLSLPL